MPDDGGTPPPEPAPSSSPLPPFTPEDSVYASIVSECLGLERAGAGLLRAALITGAHYAVLGLANMPGPPAQD